MGTGKREKRRQMNGRAEGSEKDRKEQKRVRGRSLANKSRCSLLFSRVALAGSMLARSGAPLPDVGEAQARPREPTERTSELIFLPLALAFCNPPFFLPASPLPRSPSPPLSPSIFFYLFAAFFSPFFSEIHERLDLSRRERLWSTRGFRPHSVSYLTALSRRAKHPNSLKNKSEIVLTFY